MAIDVVLWDFGDTLVDERWMLMPTPDCPQWAEIWTDVVRERASGWNTGELCESDVVAAVSARTGMDTAAVQRHVARCCRAIEFHPAAWRAATERRRPQAIVTVNPDLFVERIAAPYGLAAHFDVIVVSCAERTEDKTRLCDVALERLQFAGPRSRALLIDNRRDLVDAWIASGGAGYHYRGDDAFARDWPALLG